MSAPRPFKRSWTDSRLTTVPVVNLFLPEGSFPDQCTRKYFRQLHLRGSIYGRPFKHYCIGYDKQPGILWINQLENFEAGACPCGNDVRVARLENFFKLTSTMLQVVRPGWRMSQKEACTVLLLCAFPLPIYIPQIYGYPPTGARRSLYHFSHICLSCRRRINTIERSNKKLRLIYRSAWCIKEDMFYRCCCYIFKLSPFVLFLYRLRHYYTTRLIYLAKSCSFD